MIQGRSFSTGQKTGNPSLLRRRVLSLLLTCFLFVSVTPSLKANSALLSLGGCTVQELHSPFPKTILKNSVPEGFEPATYAHSPLPEMGDNATTSFICRRGDSVLSELWVWVPVLPPKHLRSRAVDTYGFLIKAYSNRKRVPTATERSCMRALFEPAAISLVIEEGNNGEAISSYAEGKSSSDEAHSLVASHQDAYSRRTRMFGWTTDGRVRSFDISIGSERAGTGAGAAVQNKNGLYADGTSFGVPGIFGGDAVHLRDATMTFTRPRSAGCPN